MKPKKTETNYALVSGGAVENIIVADAEFAGTLAPDYDAVVIANDTPAYIGGRHVDGVFEEKPVPVELVKPAAV